MIERISLALVSLLALSTVAFSQSERPVVGVACGPYVQNVTTDSFTVMWVSDMDAMAWLEVAPDDGTHFYQQERPKYYDNSGFGVNPAGRIHKITVSGLESGTSYRYRIMMQGVISFNNSDRDITLTRVYGGNVYSAKPPVVKTLPLSCDKVTFSVVNDIHEREEIFRKLYKDASGKYDFVHFNGDMTSFISSDEKILDCYLRAAGELFASETPIMPSRGNHEFRGSNCINWVDYYETATGKPYYTFSYGDFFFINIDSGEDKPDSDIEYCGRLVTDHYLKEEAEWLKQVVQTPEFKNARVRIVFSHIPPLTNGWHGNENVNTLFVPILNEAGVDLMLSGHEHRYRCEKPGTYGARFPVLVNDDGERLDITVTSDLISAKAYDPDGKLTHSEEFKTGQYKK